MEATDDSASTLPMSELRTVSVGDDGLSMHPHRSKPTSGGRGERDLALASEQTETWMHQTRYVGVLDMQFAIIAGNL